MPSARADICLLIEGAYPFVAGGVSAWVHALIEAQRDLRFAIVAISADERPRKRAYVLPANVVSFDVLPLHVRAPSREPLKEEIGERLLRTIFAFQRSGRLDHLRDVMEVITPFAGKKIPADFLDSESVWNALEEIARSEMPRSSFLHYFWTLRSLLSAFLSVMLAPLPDAHAYHAISTGYAGLMAARARLERRRPALLTEHGIYTNERRIEIASADWLYDRSDIGVALDENQRTLKDLWTDCFSAYARATYAASERIVTLFRGNQEMQIRDGAPPQKCMIIPNGVDCESFGRLRRPGNNRPPTVALIGRVVPIKDVKSYLRAIALLKPRIPELEALVLGPTDEDPVYHAECLKLTRELGLERAVRFTGRVSLAEYLPHIHLNVLTSLSEAQPLVVLEAGAAGVPTVATDVGACREMIYGPSDEEPKLGAGGAITPIGDAAATAEAIAGLVADREALEKASQAIRTRVFRYYSKARMDASYRHVYRALLARSPEYRRNQSARGGPRGRAWPA